MPMVGRPAAASQGDGRADRSARTHDKIIEALFSLIEEGNLSPRTDEIAERADVAVRTIFRHFEDVEGLYRAAEQEIEKLLSDNSESEAEVVPASDQPLPERLKAYAQNQGNIYEWVRYYLYFYLQRVGYAGDKSEPDRLRTERARLRLWSAIPECAAASPATRAIVEMMFTFRCWEQLRYGQALSVDDAVAYIADATQSLLEQH